MERIDSPDEKNKTIQPETLNFLYGIIKEQLDGEPESKDSILL